MAFVKATKKQAKGRVALIGLSGSGKSYTAQIIARVLAGPNGKVAAIDTENGSASKYADEFSFDTLNLASFSPRDYIAAIHEAESAGYDVLIIDSLSHAWVGKGGVLEMVDNATAKAASTGRNASAFTNGWREVTPEHNNLVDALVRCNCHLIVTIRSKADYVIENVNGKMTPRKIGLAPVQRDGLDYEFDIVADMDLDHRLIVSKSRCKAMADKVVVKPAALEFEPFRAWLSDGEALVTPTLAIPPAVQSTAPEAQPRQTIVYASSEQVNKAKDMVPLAHLAPGTLAKWFAWAGPDVKDWEDMPAHKIDRCIAEMAKMMNGNGVPATA